PHQEGAFYLGRGEPSFTQHSGKELSFTNILDFDAAWRLVMEFEEPAAVIVKHTNPCGVATGDSIEEAYMRALECDPLSAFGGIVAVNREINGDMALKVAEKNKMVSGEKKFITTDIFIAPRYTAEALTAFGEEKNIRVIECQPFKAAFDVRSAADGYLVQDPDRGADRRDEMTVAGSITPTEEEWEDMLFAWRVCKHVKSNSVVFATDGQAVGIGAGQMSRVEAVQIAAKRAGGKAKGTACATDGFFPFRDGVDAAVEAGARAIIHPGGSVRDSEIIAAADELGVPMVLTGKRHFRH
ncbi:MAG TPA: bifunctional phosphoribosylaminoimidazolecarboxamide formyltransferase/IMP cyclohydrolase, partial [Actinomycetota bacterium]|nr:bifunctional phosphoribosylaminoimidazolecarboxamide formyltransferase/IMP cyclohydrolase [Actinomycetota bacterium]